MTTLQELKALAEATDHTSVQTQEIYEANLRFEEAANPATILQMIALIEKMGEALEGVVKAHGYEGGLPAQVIAKYKERMK